MNTKIKLSNQNGLVRVNFTNRGLSKILKSEKSLHDETPNKKNVVDLASKLADIKITSADPIKFQTIPEFLGIDYVGYVIEKERLNKNTDEWVRIDEFKILGSEANSFVDTRVAYGHSYRYRIKSIIKLTQKEAKSGFSHLEALRDIKDFETKKIKENLDKNKAVLEDLDKFTSKGLSNKSSSGRGHKEVELIEGTSIRANESFTEVVSDSEVSKNNLRSLKNLKVEDLDIANGSASRSDLQKLINKNLKNFKETKIEYKSSYYESDPSKKWVYVDVVENEPPPPPETIKITPCSPKKQILISWLKPANSQRDIKFFKIYKRLSLGDNWKVVSQTEDADVDSDGFAEKRSGLIPVNSNFFIDKNVQFGKQYIYALTCVDVHGIESFLSMQIGAQLNENFIIERQEKPLKWISGSGTSPDEVDFVIKKFLNRTEQIIAKKNIFIAPTTNFVEIEKDLIIKIKSLDTHETQEIRVSLRNTNVKPNEER